MVSPTRRRHSTIWFANCYRDFGKPAAKGSVAGADEYRAGRAADNSRLLHLGSVQLSQHRYSDHPQHGLPLNPDNAKMKVY